MFRLPIRTLFLALVLTLSASASAALVAPPEAREQAVYDQVFLQRAAQVRSSQEMQRNRAREFAARDAEIMGLRGDPNKAIEDDLPVMGIDMADTFAKSYGAPIATAIVVLIVLAFGALLLYSRRMGIMLQNERMKRRRSRNTAGLDSVLGDLDRKIANGSITQRILARRPSSAASR